MKRALDVEAIECLSSFTLCDWIIPCLCDKGISINLRTVWINMIFEGRDTDL